VAAIRAVAEVEDIQAAAEAGTPEVVGGIAVEEIVIPECPPAIPILVFPQPLSAGLLA
jgi:hypothetical protein